jgi:nitronate monooxygenase
LIVHPTNGRMEAWKDVWGAGHGVGATRSTAAVEDMVLQLEREYRQAVGGVVR